MKKRETSSTQEREVFSMPDGGAYEADRQDGGADVRGAAGDTLSSVLAREVTQAVRDTVTALIPEIAAGVIAMLPELQGKKDRLLTLDEVAARLGCGKQSVIQRMADGAIIWTTCGRAADRRVKESRLNEYIDTLPEFSGSKCAAVAADRQDGGADARGKEKVA